MDLSDFLHMGGYAGYVWTAFGFTTIVMIANVVVARRRFATNLAHLKRRLSHEGSTA